MNQASVIENLSHNNNVMLLLGKEKWKKTPPSPTKENEEPWMSCALLYMNFRSSLHSYI